MGERIDIPGIGPSPTPFVQLRAETIPRGADEPFSTEAARGLADELARTIEGEVRFDTGSRALRRLSEIAPISVQDYDAFVARHERFYVYGPASWVIPKLLSQNAEVRLLKDTGDVRLYAVRATR